MINVQNGVFEHFAHCILFLVLHYVFIYLYRGFWSYKVDVQNNLKYSTLFVLYYKKVMPVV